MKNKILKITSVVLAMVLSLSMLVYAESEDAITMTGKVQSMSDVDVASQAEMEFNSTEKENDIVELDFKIKNTSFTTIQVVMRYDPKVLKPIDVNGDDAEYFEDFARKVDGFRFLNTVGLALDAQKGLFTFTVYVSPGSSDKNINEIGEYVTDSTGVSLYTFRFKKSGSEDYSFEVAAESDSKPYLHSMKDGVAVINGKLVSLETKVTISYEGKENHEMTVVPSMNINNHKPEEITDETRKEDAIFMCLGESVSIAHGKKTYIDSSNKQVVPYITNGRTMVPLRFVSESVGAKVAWEDGWDYCIITKGDKEIKITFGSAEFTVNDEVYTYDAPIEVVMNRTMVPVRFVSEHLGYDVYWQNLNQAVVITPAENPWIEGREAEETALMEVLVTIKGILP